MAKQSKFRKIKKSPFIKKNLGGQLVIENPFASANKDILNYQKGISRGEEIESILNTINYIGASLGSSMAQNAAKSGIGDETQDETQEVQTTQEVQKNNVVNYNADINTVQNPLNDNIVIQEKNKKGGNPINLFQDYLDATTIVAEDGEVIESQYGDLSKVYGKKHRFNDDRLKRPDGTIDGELVNVDQSDFIYPSSVDQSGYIEERDKRDSFAKQREQIEKDYSSKMAKVDKRFKRIKNTDIPINRTTQDRIKMQLDKLKSQHDDEVNNLQEQVLNTKTAIEFLEGNSRKAVLGGRYFIPPKLSFSSDFTYVQPQKDAFGNYIQPRNVEQSGIEALFPDKKKYNFLENTTKSDSKANKPTVDTSKPTVDTSKMQKILEKYNSLANSDKYAIGDFLAITSAINDIVRPSLVDQAFADNYVPENHFKKYGRDTDSLYKNAYLLNQQNLDRTKRDLTIARDTANRNTALQAGGLNVQRAMNFANSATLDQQLQQAVMNYNQVQADIDTKLAQHKDQKDQLFLQGEFDVEQLARNYRQNYITQKVKEKQDRSEQVQVLAKMLNEGKLNRDTLQHIGRNAELLKALYEAGITEDMILKMFNLAKQEEPKENKKEN